MKIRPLVLLIVLFQLSVIFGHPHHKREVLQYNSTTANCAALGRGKYQYRCVLTPEAIEGPYFIRGNLQRSDITEGQVGIPFNLELILVESSICRPIKGAQVYVWQCNNMGYYSGFLAENPDVESKPDDHLEPSDSSRFLRGFQYTDSEGSVNFRTIFPGWYFGRSVHLHVEVYVGKKAVHIGQLYLPDTFSSWLEKQYPYSNHTFPRVPNTKDNHYYVDGGPESTLFPIHYKSGWKASLVVGIDPNHASSTKPKTK